MFFFVDLDDCFKLRLVLMNFDTEAEFVCNKRQKVGLVVKIIAEKLADLEVDNLVDVR